MTDSESKAFDDMNFMERVEDVDARLGDQPDRIRLPHELLDLEGQTVYMVISPQGQEKNLGTCFIWEWNVGRIQDHYGKALKADDEIDITSKAKYLCYSSTHTDRGISLQDFNIIPNNYNNHAVFAALESAEAYHLFRKLQFPEDEGIARLNNEYDPFFTQEHVDRLLKNEKKLNEKSGS